MSTLSTRKVEIKISKKAAGNIGATLLEIAQELYKNGDIEIITRYNNETREDETVGKINIWKLEEKKPDPNAPHIKGVEKPSATGTEYNEYLEDEKNPDGIVNKLGRFFGGL